MPSPYGVGCAYVCMGTWSSLQGIGVTHVFLFIVRRLPSLPATFLLTTNTNTTMKRFFLFIAFLVATVSMQAQERVGAYYNSYFKKEYKVEASNSNGELSIYFDIEGNSSSDDVCVRIKEESIDSFISALMLAKQKHTEWSTVAINNNVSKMTKEMDITFPKVDICWHGSKWWFDFGHRLHPHFMITDSGQHLCVMTGTATASTNEYIDQKYYLAFATTKDFDALIEAINPTKVSEVLNNKQKVEDLFQ